MPVLPWVYGVTASGAGDGAGGEDGLPVGAEFLVVVPRAWSRVRVQVGQYLVLGLMRVLQPTVGQQRLARGMSVGAVSAGDRHGGSVLAG